MALIRTSNLVNDIRGSVGGNTFSRGLAGAQVSNRRSPRSKKASNQMQQNHYLPALSQAWRLLSDVERNSWRLKASAMTVQNSMGQPRVPSGFQVFVARNYVRTLLELSLLSTAPVDRPFSDLPFTAMDMRVRSNGLFNRIKMFREPSLIQYSCLAYIVPQSSDYFKARFKGSQLFLGYKDNVQGDEPQFGTEGNEKMLYPAFRALQQGYVFMQNVDRLTGQRGRLQLVTDGSIALSG